ncbi:hypothetical protein AK88_01505 [Plasmodium fragile]|uniref:Uncharacterized protein n=1 Tax=Plasmodium fragile TaxID=5857 RepID=A0A0D9QNZ6_PLAFR|nr:uncharacterized protein AK88_01505 [Plasmodium fragile]KJP88815.1 hypothetical protein AK88_01505 [Plasmodium fragile]
MCEHTNREDITSFYLSYIISLAYWQIYKTCEKAMQRSGGFEGSDESPHDKNKQDKVKKELCKAHLLVNNMEVMELCINYLYEEAVVRSILSRDMSTGEEQHQGHNEVDNLKCIRIMNSNEELSYYGTYLHNLKNFIRINEVTNLHARGEITKTGGEDGIVQHSQMSPMKCLSGSNTCTNLNVFETDTLLYILKITLTSHTICEDWKGKTEKERDAEMPALVSYLYQKVKKNLNHIFITMSDAKKKEFLERLIDLCVGGDAHLCMYDKDGMFGGSIEETYHLNNFGGEKFSSRLMNPLLLLFLPALLSIYTQIGIDHMQKLLKLCMYIFLFNLPLESCSSNRVNTCEKNSNGKGTYWEDLTRSGKNASTRPSQESVSKFLGDKGREHFKEGEGEVPFGDDNIVGDCLLHLDRANLESVHKCALQIVSILVHNWNGIHKMVNFILAPFDLVDDIAITLSGALSFKRFIDLFAATYEAFIRRWEKGAKGGSVAAVAADSMGEKPPMVGKSPLVPLLNKLFEAPTWDPSSELFYLLDYIYFGEEDPEISKIFYSKGNNKHSWGEEGSSKRIEIRLLDRRYLKGDNREGSSPGELKFVNFCPNEEGTIRVANLKGVMRLAGGQSSNGGGEEIGENSNSRDRDEGNFFLRRYFLHFFVQHFSLNYDLTIHLLKHSSEEALEENLHLVCNSVASASLPEHKFKHMLIWHFYLYPSHIYSHVYSIIHNINTRLLLSEENYNCVSFKPSDAFLTLCRENLLNFICTLYNYVYLVDVTEKFISISEFIWFMEREKFSFYYSLPFDVIRRDEKTLTFLEKLSSYLFCYEESDKGISKSVVVGTETMDQVKRENKSDEHMSYSISPGMIINVDASCEEVEEEEGGSYPRRGDVADGHSSKGRDFLSFLQERKENRILKYNCRYLCLIHLASIVLLHTPMEEALQKYYNVMEICILKGIGKFSNFFISKGEYRSSNKRYINGVLRSNTELVRVLFGDGVHGTGNRGGGHEVMGEQLIGREVVSLLLVLALRLLYLIMNLFNFVLAHEGQIWGSRDGSSVRGAPPKGTLEENVQFLLSYKCRLVKSLLKLIVSVPLPLARYQCACIFYVISFLNYKSFLPYDVIQDIKWYLSIASVDPHKKVRKMVVLCRARWM